MDESERSQFAVTISAMFESYGQEATKPRLLGYWMGLCDLSLGQVQKSVVEAIRCLKYLPSPAELRQYAGDRTPEDRAVLAWTDVLSALGCGPYQHVDFEDYLINATIRALGGWPTFVERFSDSESEKWARNDFLKTYQSMVRNGVDGEMAAALPGLGEKQVLNGRLIDYVPVRICCDKTRRKALPQPEPIPQLQLFRKP